MKRTVYIPHWHPTFNYDKAEPYGKLVPLVAVDFDDGENSKNNFAIMEVINDQLKDFDSELDFLLISGSPIIVSYAIGVVFSCHDRVRVLRYNKISKDYVPILLEKPNA